MYKHHQPVNWPQGLGKRPPQLNKEKPVIIKPKNNKASIKEKTEIKEESKHGVMEEEKGVGNEEKMEVEEEKKKGTKENNQRRE